MAKSQDMPILLEDGLNASLDVSTGQVTISKSVGHGSWSGGYGLWFEDCPLVESPQQRKDKAIDIVNEALSDHHEAAKKFNEAADATCKALSDLAIRTANQVALASLPECARMAVADMSTIRADCYGSPLQRISFVCRACKMQWDYSIAPGMDVVALIETAASGIAFTHRETQSFGDRHWCSQCPQEDKLIDGLTAAECLLAYETWQRADSWAYQLLKAHGGSDCVWWKTHHTLERLTPLQLEAARTAWSAELKKRQAAARERERNRVVVDYQGDD